MNTVSEFIKVALNEQLYPQLAASCLAAKDDERAGWKASLQPLARALQCSEQLGKLYIALEVPMLNTQERADAVLLGRREGCRGVVVIEIKRHQQVKGAGIGAIDYDNAPHHPCCQVRGYRSELLGYDRSLTNRTPASEGDGIVFMPCCARTDRLAQGNSAAARRYNEALVASHPVFGSGLSEAQRLAEYVANRLPDAPTQIFIKAFSLRQRSADRSVSDLIGSILRGNNPYQLKAGPQQQAFDAVDKELASIADNMDQKWDGKRRVVIVHGPAGSGKTVVAAYAATKAIANKESGGHGLKDGVLCCTSAAQVNTHRLELELAQQVLQQDINADRMPLCPLCRHDFPIVKFDKEVMCYPSEYEGIDAFKQAVIAGDEKGHSDYDSYCAEWRTRLQSKSRHELQQRDDNAPPYSFILCDEAAGLVDPRTGDAYGNHWVDGSRAMPWGKPRGPAPAHIILKSRLSVFFIDDAQGFQQQETTSRGTIRQIAEDLGAEVAEYALTGLQFRVAGSASFVHWLDQMLGLSDAIPTPDLPRSEMEEAFQIISTDRLAGEVQRLSKYQEPASSNILDHRAPRAARVLAGYAWGWQSKNNPNLLDSEAVVLECREHAPLAFRWVELNRGPEYNLGVDLKVDHCEGVPAARFFADGEPPAVRCAYPLTVRGRDFDHVLVLWGRDFYSDGQRWRVEPQLMFGHPQMRTALQRRNDTRRDRALQDAPRALAMAYRILLTRGMKTVRVWIEDDLTREYVQQAWTAFLDQADG